MTIEAGGTPVNAAQLSELRSNLGILDFSAGGQSVATSGNTLVFSNSNGLSFGLNADGGSVLTGSYTVPETSAFLTTAALSNHSHGNPTLALTGLTGTTASASNGLTLSLSAAAQSIQTQNSVLIQGSSGQITFSNSNGVSFGGNARTITASVETSYAGSNHSHGNPTLALTNLTGTTASASNGLTISLSAADPASGVALSADGSSQSAGTVVFSNSNGISFGMSGSTITATVNPGAAAGIAAIQGGTQTATSGTIVFADSNGITFGMSGSSQITASHNGITSQTAQTQSNVQGLIVSDTTYRTGDVSFKNANGITFGSSGANVVTASYTVPDTAAFLTTARASNDAIGLNTAKSNVTWTVNSSGLSLDARGYAGTATTFNGTNVSGSMTMDSVGLRLDLSAGAAAAITIIDAATSETVGQLAFTNLNGVTLSLSTGAAGSHTIVGSHNALTSQSGQAFSAGAASSAFQTLTLQDSNGISFSNNAGAIRLTHDLQFTSATSAITSNALNTSASRVINIVAATNSTAGGTASQSGNVSFSAANGLTFYTSAGGAVVANFDSSKFAGTGTSITGAAAITLDSAGLKFNGASLAGTTSGFTGANISASITHNTSGLAMSMSVAAPGAATLSAYAVSNTTQSTSGTFPGAMSFQGVGGVSVGVSNGSVIIQGPDVSSLSATGALSASSNGSTISLGVGTVTASVIGNTTQTSSGSINLNALVFSGAGGASLGVSAGSIIVSGAAAGGGVAISAAGSSQSAGTLVFSNSNGVSFGMNGSTVTASVAAGPAAGIAAVGASNTTYTSGTVSLVAGAGAITVGSDTGQRISFAVPATSSLVGVSGLSVSTNGSTISVVPIAGSYFAWPIPVMVNTQTQAVQSNTSVVVPFEAHYVEAFGFMMMPATVSIASMASIATAANNTKSYTQAGTFNMVLYTRGVGASSQSLQSLASTTHSSQMTIAIGQNANGSQWTVSHGFTFPASNTAQATFSTSYATTLSNVNVSTTHLTAFSGIKKLAFPWAATLTDGQYWLAYGMNTAHTTNGNASLSNMRVTASNLALTQVNLTFGEFGNANAASVQGQFGLGSYSNVAVGTTASIGLSEISSSASHAVPYLSFGRIA